MEGLTQKSQYDRDYEKFLSDAAPPPTQVCAQEEPLQSEEISSTPQLVIPKTPPFKEVQDVEPVSHLDLSGPLFTLSTSFTDSEVKMNFSHFCMFIQIVATGPGCSKKGGKSLP